MNTAKNKTIQNTNGQSPDSISQCSCPGLAVFMRGETMNDITLIDDSFWKCPRCNTKNRVCVEHDPKGDRVKCGTCAVYFHRIGWTYRFKSADNRKVYISDAKMRATA